MFRKVVLLLISAALCSSCVQKTMTADELRIFIADEENGLSKQISDPEKSVDITYWPRQLLFKNSGGDVNEPELQDVDYFMVRCVSCTEAYLSQQTVTLVVNGKEIPVLDVLKLPQSGTTVRNYAALYAFRSNLKAVADSDAITFTISNGLVNNTVVFSSEKIKMIQGINIVK